jgi:hypothetical protein
MTKNTQIAGPLALMLGIAMTASISLLPKAWAADDLPQVQLNADNIAPRPIEELTSKVVPRDYALAWQTMADALEQNRVDLLNGYFTGFAKENLTKLITDQKRTGVRVRYVDHGHKLEGVFYAPAGDAMQLRDHARLEVQLLDGSKLIHSEMVTQNYLVLLTPGADRWLVRDLEVVREASQSK